MSSIIILIGSVCVCVRTKNKYPFLVRFQFMNCQVKRETKLYDRRYQGSNLGFEKLTNDIRISSDNHYTIAPCLIERCVPHCAMAPKAPKDPKAKVKTLELDASVRMPVRGPVFSVFGRFEHTLLLFPFHRFRG